MPTVHPLPRVELMPLAEVQAPRPAALLTSGPAWQAVGARLRLDFAWRGEVREATLEHWQALAAQARHAAPAALYAVGGGLTADAAKYVAVELGLPLTVIPTALSVDAFFTPASGLRQAGCVIYRPTKAPETVVLDLEVIAAAPRGIRAAGICDVLSIATGAWDWQFAEARGQNPSGMGFIPWAYDNAHSILRGTLDCAEAAGRGNPQGLKALYDCLALEVQLCNQIGHSRPEEGSEHYFAYLAENYTGHGWPHGDLVGPGIVLMAERQGQESAPLRRALQACGVPLDRIPPEAVERTLQELPAYCRVHDLPFGVAHTL